MKRAVLKFKPGAGAIIAFFILAVVFASVAGVVFIAINQSPGKTPSASNSFAAGNLSISTQSCNGNTASVMYRWSKAYYYTAGGADYQYLDVGTDSGFPAGTYYGQNVGGSTSKAGTVDKTQTLYWRINTHYSNGAWAASDSQRISVTCPAQTTTPTPISLPSTGAGNTVDCFMDRYVYDRPGRGGYLRFFSIPKGVSNWGGTRYRVESIAEPTKYFYEPGFYFESPDRLNRYLDLGDLRVRFLTNPERVCKQRVTYKAPTQPACVDDINRDGLVNDTDSKVVAKYFGPAVPAGSSEYDVNQDAKINSLDLQEIAWHYGQSCNVTADDAELDRRATGS